MFNTNNLKNRMISFKALTRAMWFDTLSFFHKYLSMFFLVLAFLLGFYLGGLWFSGKFFEIRRACGNSQVIAQERRLSLSLPGVVEYICSNKE